MNASAPTRRRSSGPRDSGGASSRSRPRRPTRARALWRRLGLLGGVAVVALIVTALVSPLANKAAQEIALPLRHEDIIRQQAHDKRLDPALLAAVIYQESRFRDGQRSDAGAQGLMQLMPQTARYIARLSGGTAFVEGDLATAQVNISYGAFYLRYLEDKYRGSPELALAAYNAGEGKLDEWLSTAADRGETFDPAAHIPFAETRDYVASVMRLRDDYERQYAAELGL